MATKAKAAKAKQTGKTKKSPAAPVEKGKTKGKKQALDGKRGNVFYENPFSLVLLGIDTSEPERGSDLFLLLHKHRISRPLSDGMLDSISENGVEKAITVAKVWLPVGMTLRGRELKRDEQHTIVIDGRRRVRHTRELCVRAGDPLGTKGSYTIKTNTPRMGMSIIDLAFLAVELNEHSEGDNPLEKAAQARLLIARTNNEERVAKSFGWGVHHLHEMLKLLGEGAPAVHEAIQKGDIKASPAAQLTRLPEKQQEEIVKNAVSTGKTSAAQIRGAVRRKEAENQGTPKSQLPSVKPQARDLRARLDFARGLAGRSAAQVKPTSMRSPEEIALRHKYLSEDEYDDHTMQGDAAITADVLGWVLGQPGDFMKRVDAELARKGLTAKPARGESKRRGLTGRELEIVIELLNHCLDGVDSPIMQEIAEEMTKAEEQGKAAQQTEGGKDKSGGKTPGSTGSKIAVGA